MKQGKVILLTSAISAVLLVTTASAAFQYSLADLNHLQDAVLLKANLTAADDVDGDGVVNGFDIGILKMQLLSDAGEVITSSYPATEEYVKLQGRTNSSDDTTWLAQSGSAAEFIVTANSAQLTLAGSIGITSETDKQPRYAVYVDGELLVDTTMSTESCTVPLWDGTTSRKATVKVVQLSEAMYGGIGVKSIDVTSSAALPVKPVPKNELCIEFIGDSITCAYGVEGTSSSDPFKTTTENFTKSYAYLTAQKLGADYSAVCYSGHGIVSGYSSGDKNADSLIPDCYDLISKHYTTPWDFEKSRNDVVVINLGTNDINYVAAEPETRSEEFIEGYIGFLKTIREKNPDAYIICTLGTMGGEDIYALIEQAAERYKTETGDERIMYYASATQNAADGYGSDWHPSAVTQQNSAYVLADKICQALGMESDQVGLDVAAGAVYDVAIDQGNGANAAFYVGYDMSFWINMVTGGSEPEAIEALISGFALKDGGEYRLSFDYTTTVDHEIPVLVRGTDTYFSDSVSATGDKQHFEAEFAMNTDDSAAEIVFQLGGLDYYNVTLSNVKLVKIK